MDEFSSGDRFGLRWQSAAVTALLRGLPNELAWFESGVALRLPPQSMMSGAAERKQNGIDFAG
jgi:hypothetical protein